MNKIPKNYGAILSTLIYVLMGSHKARQGEKVIERKYLKKIMVKSSEICKENPLT